jgi:hypothetical protein
LVNRGSPQSASTGFQRSFLIFSNEDGGFEAGQKPSGHVKIEVREGRGKLHAAVQNLRPGNGRFVYRLYLLDTGGGEIKAAYTGQLMPEPNKAELEWSFDPQNVGATGAAIGNFNMAAVLVEHEHSDYSVVCPLAAYKGRKTEWRSGLRTALAKKGPEIKNTMETKKPAEMENSISKVEAPVNIEKPNNEEEPYKAEGKPHKAEEKPYKAAAEEPCKAEVKSNQEGMQIPVNEEWQTGGLPIQQDYILQDYMPLEQAVQEYSAYGQIMQDNLQTEKQTQEQAKPYDWQQEKTPQELPLQEQILQDNLQKSPYEQDNIKQEQVPQPQQAPQQEQAPQPQDIKYQGTTGQIDTGCVYLNGNICGAFVNNGAGAVNPCTVCHLHHGRPHYSEPPAGDVSQLREELDRYFEQCDPFHSNRSDYMWWRVSNPVNLNNMLYQCNIRSPLLFNPAVMMAHYKYRHLIVGIFLHRAKEKQYIVCGVPGMNMVDRKPFGDMSRWVQAEGNRPRYGAFGYWLVYIDPDGGKILNMSQE